MWQKLSSWGLAGLAAAGLYVSFCALQSWAPDAAVSFPPPAAALKQAYRDAERLGYRPGEKRYLAVAAGSRFVSSVSDVQVLAETHRDGVLRRRLLREAPPLRLGIRFYESVGPEGFPGMLRLEYDAGLRLRSASFNYNGLVPFGEPQKLTPEFADRVAEVLLDAPSPRQEVAFGDGMEYVYRQDANEPGAHVYLANTARWLAGVQPVANPMMVYQSRRLWTAGERVRIYVLAGIVLLGLGVLMWRLSLRRAGLSQVRILALVLGVGLLPALPFLFEPLKLLALIWSYYLLTHVGVLLIWLVGEAELREARPGSIEHWDRIRRRRPIRGTGTKLLVGFAVGCVMGAVRAGAGALAGLFGGGYSNVLAIMPDYWTLTSPLTQGMGLAAMTALLSGFGGRLWGRPGAVLGAAVNTACWSLVIWTTPFEWALGLGFVASLVAGWLVWHHGILALSVAAVTSLSLPTAWIAWEAFPLNLMTAAVASLPFLLPLAGFLLLWRAPRYGSAEEIAPAYVSELERSVRLDAEIELLRTLQLSLLPPETLKRAAGAEIAWEMNPADQVGGDFLDVVEDADGRLWIAVADAAGHGISCSVLTAYTKAAVIEHAVAGATAADAMDGIRSLFARLRISRTLVTLLVAVWNPKSRELAVASAGHLPLLVCDGENVRELGLPGAPLGVELGEDSGEERCACPGETVLVAYSDGVVEASSPAGEAFGYERWPALLPGLCKAGTPTVLAELLAAVDAHRAGHRAADDVTAIVVRLPG